MNNVSEIKALFKESEYDDLVQLVESDTSSKLKDSETIEQSIIRYCYVRSLLELGFIGKAMNLAEYRYKSSLKSNNLELRLYDIVAYAYALMNSGLYQAMTNIELEGNGISTKLLVTKEKNNDLLEVITLFKNIVGNAFLLTDNLDKALEYYKECLNIREKIPNNDRFIADSLLNIGIVYLLQGNYNHAYEYEAQALQLKKKIDEKFGILNTSVNIVILKINQGKWNEASELIVETMKLAVSLKNLKFESILLQMLSDINENKGKLDEAIRYYIQSLNIKEKIGNKKLLADILVSIGYVYIEKKEYQQALDYFNKSSMYYTISGSNFHMINSTFWIFWIYYTIGNESEIELYVSEMFKDLERYNEIRINQIFIITKEIYASFKNGYILDDENALAIQDLLKKRDIVDLKLQIIASNLLCIYKLNKLKIGDSIKLRNEISELFENIYNMGVEKNSYKYMVISLILKAKFNLILGNIEITFNALKSGMDYAPKYELDRLIYEIELEEKEVQEKIELWYNDIPINPPIAEKIDNSNILDYLKDIMNII